MEEEYKIEEEKKIEIDPLIEEIAEKRLGFSTNNCPGCGPQLGLKLALQEIGNCILVNSSGCMAELGLPNSIHCGLNAVAGASAISRVFGEGINVLCYAGDGATNINLQAVIAAAERNDNVIYICYNNQGYCYMGKAFKKLKSIARSIPASYVATASIGYPEDYVQKIRKALSIKGFRFIELFSPCPVILGSDTSNTVAIARLGVETGLWPLYEIEKRRLSLTYKPSKLEPMERYFELQDKSKPSDEGLQVLQQRIDKRWEALSRKS